MVDGEENYKFDLEVKGFIYTRVTRDIVELLRIKYVKEKNNKKNSLEWSCGDLTGNSLWTVFPDWNYKLDFFLVMCCVRVRARVSVGVEGKKVY